MRRAAHSTTDCVARRTGNLEGSLLLGTRSLVKNGVGLHIKPGLGDIHEADTSLFEFPLFLLSFPDRVDIKSEAEEEETFRRLPLNLLRADGRGTD